jgi:hypothetical protein
VVVVGDDARVEDEAVAGGERLGREDPVLAAVALVPAERRVARHGEAVGGEEADVAWAAAREVRRLRLEVGDPAPRRRAREGAGAADERVRELGQGRGQACGPAGRRYRVRVEEDDDVAAGRLPAAVARPAGEERRLVPEHARARRARDRPRAVRRRVVDDDHLGRMRLLARDRVEDGSDRPLRVVRGDDDADRRGHLRMMAAPAGLGKGGRARLAERGGETRRGRRAARPLRDRLRASRPNDVSSRPAPRQRTQTRCALSPDRDSPSTRAGCAPRGGRR